MYRSMCCQNRSDSSHGFPFATSSAPRREIFRGEHDRVISLGVIASEKNSAEVLRARQRITDLRA
jgi:hypothetical protein